MSDALYFAGKATDLGHVQALPCLSFDELCLNVLSQSVQLPITRGDFHLLPKKDKQQPMDQDRAKRVRYVTPAAFHSSPSQRNYESARTCNLIALDIDPDKKTGIATEAKRLLSQNWEGIAEFGHLVWHTASSTKECPRLRVLVSAAAIPPDRYPDAVRTIAELLGMTIITTESRVSVQPMFFPTVFKGEEMVDPVIAQNASGEPFTLSDILGEDETSVDESVGLVRENPADDGSVADITHLQAPMDGITLEIAAAALEVLDPDMPMQEWIEVAAGLKHQFDSAEAYQIWDAWSAKGEKYEGSKETAYRWKSLKANPEGRAPVTIRSVLKTAQLRGWVNPTLAEKTFSSMKDWLESPERSTEELLDQGSVRIAQASAVITALEKKSLMVGLKTAMSARGIAVSIPDIKKEIRRAEVDNAKNAEPPTWTKGVCYITAINKFYRHTTDRQFAPEVIDLMYSAPAVGDDQPMRPRDFLIQMMQVPQVEQIRYDPSRGSKRFFTEDGKPFVNSYRPNFAAADITKADEAGEIFMEHIRHLVAEPEYQTLLIDFLAYHVKHPGRKIRWSTLIQSGQGAGKTFLAVAMTAVLGRRNVRKLSATNVTEGSQNDWAYGAQLNVLEEVRIVGQNRYTVMDKLKPCISDDEISLRKMYEPPRTVPNCTNYLMFTNHHDSLAIHDDDRRYFVLASPLQRPEDIAALGGPKYFKRLFNMVRDNAGGLRAWFEQWEPSVGFNPDGRAPVTPYLRDLADNSATPLAAAIKTTIEDEPHPLVRRDLLSTRTLREVIEGQNLPNYTDQALYQVLREMGWAKRDRVTLDGTKHQIWSHGRIRDPRRVVELRHEFL